MAKSDKIALVKVGDVVVLLVEVYPTAIMVALEEDQALALARRLNEIVDEPSEETTEQFMERLLKGKKPSGEAS